MQISIGQIREQITSTFVATPKATHSITEQYETLKHGLAGLFELKELIIRLASEYCAQLTATHDQSKKLGNVDQHPPRNAVPDAEARLEHIATLPNADPVDQPKKIKKTKVVRSDSAGEKKTKKKDVANEPVVPDEPIEAEAIDLAPLEPLDEAVRDEKPAKKTKSAKSKKREPVEVDVDTVDKVDTVDMVPEPKKTKPKKDQPDSADVKDTSDKKKEKKDPAKKATKKQKND